MSKHRLAWPSLARIVAMVGILAVLASAATALPGKGVVDKNDLKKNVVKSKHIKNGQVGAADLTNPEPFHVVGAAGQPAFGTGGDGDCIWQNTPSTLIPDLNPTSFFRDADGIVHLAGVPLAEDGPGGDAICDSDVSDLIIYQLPSGYAPDHLEIFPSVNSTVQANIVVPETGVTLGGEFLPPGAVVANLISDGQATTLDGITFRAAGGAGAGSSPDRVPSLSLKDLRDLLS